MKRLEGRWLWLFFFFFFFKKGLNEGFVFKRQKRLNNGCFTYRLVFIQPAAARQIAQFLHFSTVKRLRFLESWNCKITLALNLWAKKPQSSPLFTSGNKVLLE